MKTACPHCDSHLTLTEEQIQQAMQQAFKAQN